MLSVSLNACAQSQTVQNNMQYNHMIGTGSSVNRPVFYASSKYITQKLNARSLKRIDITSIVEILAHFDMLEEFAHILSTKYIQDIIKLIKTGNKLLNDSNNMKERFKTVINNVHDGLIAINKENKVSVFNPVAEQLFDKKSLAVTGQPIENVLDSELLKTVDNPRKEGVLKLHSHEILVSEMPLYTKNTDKGRLYVLKDVSEIHRLEESVRRRLYQEQNIARYQFGCWDDAFFALAQHARPRRAHSAQGLHRRLRLLLLRYAYCRVERDDGGDDGGFRPFAEQR